MNRIKIKIRVSNHDLDHNGLFRVTLDVGKYLTIGDRTTRGTLYLEGLDAEELKAWPLGEIMSLMITEEQP